MAKQYLMSLDLGGSGGRALLYETTSGELTFKTIEWDFHPDPAAGDYAFDLGCDAKWKALCAIGREALAAVDAGPDDVAGISVTSMRHGMVLLDKQGRPLVATPNKDARAITESMELQGERGEELYQRTGHVPSPVLLAPRLLWLKESHPDLLEKADVVLTISDWMAYQLCGVAVSEPSQAGETLLFDLAQAAWAFDIIESMGLPKRIFPDIRKPGDKLGGLTKTAAEALGLKEGIPVAVGGADSQLGLLGLGVTAPGDVVVVAGSTTPVMATTSEPKLHPEMRTWAGMHVIPGVYVAESNAGGMGTALEWIASILYPDSPFPIAALSGDAASAPPGAGGVLSTVGTQLFHAAELGLPVEGMAFSSMTTPGGLPGRSHLARGVLEGMAFASLANAEQALEVAGLEPGRVFAGGGMTRSALFGQLLADSFGRPATIGYGQRTTPFGAVICAAVGAGLHKDLATAAREMSTAVETIQPSEHVDTYEELYAIWREHLDARGSADAVASQAIMQAMQASMAVEGTSGEPGFKPNVYIAASLGEDARAQLEAVANVTYAPYAEEGILSGDEMVEKLQDVHVLVTEVDLVDADALQGLPNLRVVISCRGNPVNVDIPACTAAGVPVINTPGRNADAVADLAMAYILMLVRKLDKATAFLRQGDIEAGDMGRMGQAYFTLKANEVWKKTVGVIGGGAIGRRMIERLRTFGADVLLFDPYIDAESAALMGARKAAFHELLAASDIVTLHAPVTDETTGMMDQAAFDAMKEGAFLVNTARAALIEQDALLAALESGKVAGGAFDVFPVEPPGSDDPLLAFENVIVTPHIGGNTEEIGIHQGEIVVDELTRLLTGGRPQYILNADTLPGFRWTGERKRDEQALEEIAKGPGPGMTDLDVKAKEEAVNAEPEDKGKSTGLFARLTGRGKKREEPVESGSLPVAEGMSDLETNYAAILETFLKDLAVDEDTIAFAKKKNVSFQFILKNSSLQFYMGFNKGEVATGMGEAPFKPDVVVKMDADTFDGMFTGRIDGNDAFKSGKLSVSGNMLKAMAMQKLDFGRVYSEAVKRHGGTGDLTAIGAAPPAGRTAPAAPASQSQPAAPASSSAGEPDVGVFNKVIERFVALMNDDPDTQAFAERKNVTFQYTIKDAGTVFYQSFIKGKTECGMGEAPMKVDVNIKTDAATLDGMFSGRLDGAAAFKTGKLSVGGNMMKAMVMQKLDFGRLYTQAVADVGDPGFGAAPAAPAQKQAAPAAAAAPQPVAAPAAPALIQKVGDIRDEILEINNELYARGWITYTGGNISARSESNPGEVWITPSGINKGSLQPSMMVKINLDGEMIGEANYNASSERMVHTAIMKARPEIKAVIHTHAANATLMALTDTKWEPISADAAFFGQIPVVPFIMPGSSELAEKVAEAVGAEGMAAIMQNHGLVVAGTTLRRAADMTEMIELTAAKLLLCRQLGVSPATLPEDVVEMLREMGALLA